MTSSEVHSGHAHPQALTWVSICSARYRADECTTGVECGSQEMGFGKIATPLVTTLITRVSERCRVRAVFYDCRTRGTGS
jgi:hypothetical protein